MKTYGVLFAAICLGLLVGMVNPVNADPIQPVSYDMLNGEGGVYAYLDGSYTGSGSPGTSLSPLSGGLGELTDGVIATDNWWVTPYPYVGWYMLDPTITFHFGGVVTIDEVTIHIDDANDAGWVNPPQSVDIEMGGTTLNFPVTNPPGSAPISVTFSGLNLTGESLDLTLIRWLLHGMVGWVMLSEVTFDGTRDIDVDVDIKPGSDQNPINLKSKGVIPVAILTTDDFDAADVDGSTVTFAGASPAHGSGHLEDVDGDGDLDWIGHFRTQETNISDGETEASVAGQTTGGINLKGSDGISITKGSKKGKAGKPTLSNHPNPFNPATTIHYSLEEATDVRLTIYNVLGQPVRTLVQGGQGSGVHHVVWDGRDALGHQVTSGLYLYRLEAGQQVAVRKMILAK